MTTSSSASLRDVLRTMPVTKAPHKQETSCCGHLLVALGIIALLGSGVATYLMHAKMGNLAFSIAGGGALILIVTVVMKKYFYTRPVPADKAETDGPSVTERLFAHRKNTVEKKAAPVITNPPPGTHPLALNELVRMNLLQKDHPILQTNMNRHNDNIRCLSLTQWNALSATDKAKYPDVVQRIKDLDAALQFSVRVAKLNCADKISIGAVLFSWTKAHVGCIVMTDEELAKATVEMVVPMGMDALAPRIIEAAKKIPKATSLNQPANSILVVDLPKLTADVVNKNPQTFPVHSLILMASKELQKLELEKFTTEQIEGIYQYQLPWDWNKPDGMSTSFNTLFTPQQINKSLSLVSNLQILPGAITPQQRRALDLVITDKKYFDALYSGNNIRHLQYESLDRIYKLCKFFDSEHWKSIGSDHAKNLECSKIPKEKLDLAIASILDTDAFADALIPTLKDDKLYAFAPFLSETQWDLVEESLRLKFDFTKLPDKSKRADIFARFVNPYEGNGIDSVEKTQAYKFFNNDKVKPKVIQKYIPYFSQEHWSCIPFSKLKELDFTKADGVHLQYVAALFRHPNHKQISQLPTKQQKALKPLLPKEAAALVPK